MVYLSKYGILLAFVSCLLFSGGLHYKKEDEKIKYGLGIGFAENLNWKGRVLFFVGLIFVSVGAMSSID